MPSNVFTRADRRNFIRAVAKAASQNDLTIFESGLQGVHTAGPREARSAEIIRHIFDEMTNTDSELMALLDHVFVESPQAEFRMEIPEFLMLREDVLKPRGVRLTEDGFAVHRPPRRQGNSPSTGSVKEEAALRPWSDEPELFSLPTTKGAPKPGARDQVFIVHGRDMAPVKVLEQYLAFVGLSWLGWSKATELSGRPTPHTFEIIKAGMEAAAAIIILFSPDEEARLHSDFRGAGDSDEFQRQSRQNVLLEAGMAFGMAPERTIFVKSNAAMREISDVAGFNWITMDGEWESREGLNIRLRSAGAEVKPRHSNLGHHLAGSFTA